MHFFCPAKPFLAHPTKCTVYSNPSEWLPFQKIFWQVDTNAFFCVFFRFQRVCFNCLFSPGDFSIFGGKFSELKKFRFLDLVFLSPIFLDFFCSFLSRILANKFRILNSFQLSPKMHLKASQILEIFIFLFCLICIVCFYFLVEEMWKIVQNVQGCRMKTNSPEVVKIFWSPLEVAERIHPLGAPESICMQLACILHAFFCIPVSRVRVAPPHPGWG